LAAENRLHRDTARGFPDNSAYNSSFPAQLVARQRGKGRTGRFACNNANDLALVCEVEGVEPENLAHPLYLGVDGDGDLVKLDAKSSGLGDFIDHACKPAARGIAQEIHAGTRSQ